MLRVLYILTSLILFLAPGVSQAACPPPPVASASDTVIQMRAHGGNAGVGPTNVLDATESGAVVFNDADKSLYVCDGTAWVKLGGGGGGGGGAWASENGMQCLVASGHHFNCIRFSRTNGQTWCKQTANSGSSWSDCNAPFAASGSTGAGKYTVSCSNMGLSTTCWRTDNDSGVVEARRTADPMEWPWAAVGAPSW